MPCNAPAAYLESEILCASGIELVRILYRSAIEAVEQARLQLRQGDIAARGRYITRAMTVMAELSVSLNHEAGGELSRTLAELYDYISRRLIEAHTQQVEPPLAEVSKLLNTLLEGWASCAAPALSTAPPQHEAPVPVPHVEEHEAEYASQSWSF